MSVGTKDFVDPTSPKAFQHELRPGRGEGPGVPPKPYRDAVFSAHDKGEPPPDKLAKLLQETGRTMLQWKLDVATFRKRRRGERLLARARGLNAKADASGPVESTRARADATAMMTEGHRLLGLPTAVNPEDTLSDHLRERYEAAGKSGMLAEERNTILAQHGRDFAKRLAKIDEEIGTTEAAMETTIDGRPLLNRDNPLWVKRTRFTTQHDLRAEEGREPDQRRSTEIVAEEKEHLGELREQRARVARDEARLKQLAAEIDAVREQAERVLAECCDVRRGMKWATL